MAVSVCGRFGLWPFRFVAVPVCGRFGLWLLRSVAVLVCGHSGLWPFRSVAVPVCGRFGLWPFRFWPFRFVAVMTRIPPCAHAPFSRRWQRGRRKRAFVNLSNAIPLHSS